MYDSRRATHWTHSKLTISSLLQALELFVESLLKRSAAITNSRNAKTLSTSHVKQCIMSESRFDFLKDLVKTVPDIGQDEQSEAALAMTMPSTCKCNFRCWIDNPDRILWRAKYETFSATNGDTNGQSHRLAALQRSQSHQPATNSSAPSTSTSCHYLQLNQQKFYLNNYTNQQQPKPNSSQHHPARISRNNSLPASATITSEQQQHQECPKPIPLNFPIQISYSIDGESSSSSGVDHQLESPAVKIDYSNFTLPATSPSIKIDLSNFTQPARTASAAPASSNAPPSATANNLDEDYDVWGVWMRERYFLCVICERLQRIESTQRNPLDTFNSWAWNDGKYEK